jgi:hypothetical protein
MIYGEVAADARVNIVAVIEDGDWLDRVDEPIYFSTEMAMSGDRIRERSRYWVAERAHLLGIALTMDPLTAGAVRSSAEAAT